MASPIADILHKAAELNADDPRRTGNVIDVAPGCEMLVAGDIHGHRANLTKIIAYADLANHPDRRLVLQEIVHAPPDPRTGQDRSVDVLLRAARLKAAHPEQVLFLLANHDVAQATGNEITKGGRGVCEAFAEGVRYAVGEDNAAEVIEAVVAFLLSLPIAVRCPSGVMILHTLPDPRRSAQAGPDIPSGAYDPAALRRGGCVYEWTWGRGQTAEQIETLCEQLAACFFVLAHRHITTSHEVLCPKAIILTADHDRGCLLQFRSDEPLCGESAVARLKPIASLRR